MPPICDEYILAHAVVEALEALSVGQGRAHIIAGGSDLLLDIQQGRQPPVHTLVDVTEIAELSKVEIRGEKLFIGACVTLERLKKDRLIRRHAQALSDAAIMMANPQVCNVATIGGNVVYALPAADGTIALLALEAEAEIASIPSRRMVPLQALFKGPGESTLDPCLDLLVGFYVPCQKDGQASAFARRVNPQGIGLAMLNLAIWLERREGKVTRTRISLGPSGPISRRMPAAENVLTGQQPSAEARARVIEEIIKETQFRTSPHRASAGYRRHLADILLEEALNSAWERAGS